MPQEQENSKGLEVQDGTELNATIYNATKDRIGKVYEQQNRAELNAITSLEHLVCPLLAGVIAVDVELGLELGLHKHQHLAPSWSAPWPQAWSVPWL